MSITGATKPTKLRNLIKIAKVSGPTATRDLGAMERGGVMRRSESGGRSTVYWINF